MSISQFRSEDWVYVADSMGRIGQGYYKNRQNPNQKITVAEFEQRRAETPRYSEKNKEQNINIKAETVSSSSDAGLLASASGQEQILTPWDNPVVGEQAASTPVSSSKTKQDQPVQSLPEQTFKNDPKAAQKTKPAQSNSDHGPGEGGGGNEASSSGVGGGDKDGGGAGGSAKVVCSELVRQGRMSESDRRSCTCYAQRCLPASFMVGYHFWAVPYVRLMRKSRLATALIVPVVSHRTREIKHRLGLAKTGSWFGKFVCALHDPFCCWIGRYVKQKSYQDLYHADICAA